MCCSNLHFHTNRLRQLYLLKILKRCLIYGPICKINISPNLWTVLQSRTLLFQYVICWFIAGPLVYHLFHVQPTVLVLESYVSQDLGSNSSLPRQYSGYHDRLRDLRFNYAPENRISIGKVSSCIDVRIFLCIIHRWYFIKLSLTSYSTPKNYFKVKILHYTWSL